jgi:hypothetical protein
MPNTCRDRETIVRGLGNDYAAFLTADTPMLAEHVQSVDGSAENLLGRLAEFHAQTALVCHSSFVCK